jgi:DNA gyrase subunit A
VVNLIEMDREDRVQAVVPVREFDDQHFLVLATRQGLIKKTVLSAYGNPRRSGINAILLEDGDQLIEASITDGTQDVVLAKRLGKAVRFHENEVRSMGRTTYGVKATTLEEGDTVVSMVAVKRDGTLLAVTENGYGKRSAIGEYRVSHRGGIGVITIKTTERNGNVVGVKEVVDGEELMLMTRQGQVIRMPVSGISVIGRNTQGVRLVALEEGDQVTDVTRVVSEDRESAAGDVGPSGNGSGADDEGAGDDAGDDDAPGAEE